MMSPWVGIGLALFSGMVGAAVRVFDFTPKQKQVVGWSCVGGAVIGLLIAVYGFSTGGSASDVKAKPSITQQGNQGSQMMTDSPWGVQIQGDNNTVTQGPQPRKLTPVQEERFVQVLKANPKGHVAVTCIESGGPEPCNFARQLVRLLESQDAGWTVTFSPIMFGGGDPTKTIPPLYLEAQSEIPPPFAFALREALKAADHEPVCLTKVDQPPDFLQLTVWHKGE